MAPSRYWSSAFVLALAGVLALAACRRDTGERQRPTPEPRRVESESVTVLRTLDIQPGKPLEAVVGPGETVAGLELKVGQAVVVAADQHQVDVVLEMRPPRGEPLVVDLPTRQTIPERLCFVAETAGRHELIVRASSAGEETLTRLDSRIDEATAAERACVSAMTAIGRGQWLETQGEAEEAYASYRHASEWARAAADPALEASALLLRLEVAENRTSPTALADAVRDGNAALDRLAGKGFPRFEVLLQERIANVERIRGNLEPSRRLFLESLEQAKRIGDIPGMARAHTGLGRIAQIHSDLATAEAEYREALGLWERENRPSDHALTLVHLASVFTIRSDLVAARDFLDEAEHLLPSDETASRLEVLVQAGWIDFLDKRFDAAIESYERALALAPRSKRSLDRGGILDRIASAERSRGNLAKAETLYQQALEIYRYAGGASVAHTSYSLGELYAQQGRYREARPLLEEALESFRALGDDNALAHLLTTLGDLERASGHLDEALNKLGEAAERFETRWRDAFRKGDLARPTALVQDVDSKYVSLLMELAEAESNETLARRAFERSDRARDRNLLALIGAGIGRTGSPTPVEAAARRRLREEIEELEMRRSEGSESLKIDPDLRQLQLELEATEREIRSRIAEQVPLPGPLDSARLQRQLPAGTCILSYVLGAERSHLFLVCPDTFKTAPLPPRETLEARASALVTALSGSDQRGTEDQAAFMLQSAAETLLGPIGQDLVDVERLIVVAEGALAQLPFAALPDPAAQVAYGAPMLARLGVTQGPSVSVLAELVRRAATRPKRSGPIVVFADPVYSELDHRLPEESATRARAMSRPGSRYWARLPATRDEALAIEALAPETASIRLDFAASRRAVLDGALENAAIIQFATHSDLDEAVPTSSGLVLSRFDEQGRRQPSHLRIRDIRSLELGADLVVLSACRSGWDKPIRGDALMGLAQAFFVAGASRVIVSLWPVDDDATAVLMQSFYRQLLAENADPVTALRLAQMEMRGSRKWRAPSYWAGFVLLGGWR